MNVLFGYICKFEKKIVLGKSGRVVNLNYIKV